MMSLCNAQGLVLLKDTNGVDENVGSSSSKFPTHTILGQLFDCVTTDIGSANASWLVHPIAIKKTCVNSRNLSDRPGKRFFSAKDSDRYP